MAIAYFLILFIMKGIMRCTKAIIHLDNFKKNIKAIKSFTKPGTKMCVAVKADAYGHGAVQCAKAAVACGVDFLAVATVDEGVQLRTAGIKKPILMLSLCCPEEVPVAVAHKITPLVFDKEYISLFDAAAHKQGLKKYAVHLAVDTGMGRIGCLPEEAVEIAEYITSCKSLVLGGMQTHFAVSDSTKPENRRYTKEQFKRFTQAIDSVKEAGINPGICHCANSAATLDLPEMHLDMVRPGIIVYGYYPDMINKAYLQKKGTPINLKPVMTLETEVSAIRPFTKGRSVGYGRTWTASSKTDIGVLPIGYADAFFRRFSTLKVKVAIKGKEYPVRGRVCMDQVMIDLGKHSKVKRWDKVVIFGDKKDGALQTAQDIATLTDTISYEITSAVTKRVPRVFVK
jgi:alanine racemase